VEVVQHRLVAGPGRRESDRGGGHGLRPGHLRSGDRLVHERQQQLGPLLGVAQPDRRVGLDPEPLEALAVDIRAVARAGVLGEPGIVDRTQPQVLARDEPVVDAEPGFGPAADRERLAGLGRERSRGGDDP
jgi:hypothetical protein